MSKILVRFPPSAAFCLTATLFVAPLCISSTNVERYPNSANVYDSLAEAYEKGGKLELAAPLYEKAQSLGKQNNDPNAAIYTANFARASDKLKQAAAAKPTDAAKQADAAKKNQ